MTDTILTYGQPIRLAGWHPHTYATTFTVEGYAIATGHNPAAERERALSLGHAIAGSVYIGEVLTTSRSFYAQKEAIAATAITLDAGQTVEIEGRLYTVRIVPGNTKAPRISDPIAFLPIAALQTVEG
jgi:hypothetical protein